MTSGSVRFVINFLIWYSFCLFLSTSGCPTNQTLTAICKCENSFNGISLDCSGNAMEAGRIMQILRENQAQLGLVQQLTLQNGTLTEISDGMFDGLFVKKLDLTNNRLVNVSAAAFRGLENIMQILILRKNRLKRLPLASLTGMTSLIQLDFSENQLADITDDAETFGGMPKLTDLNLSNNRICNLHKDVFENIKSTLQTLNLGGNCFGKVPASSLRGFKQLLALHLHSNRIGQLEPLQFMNLPFLNLINLANNKIRDIHRQSFLNVPNLRFMYLSENNLTSLEADQFRTFENLELLDLTKNRLTSLVASSFANLPKLTQLYLGDNDISIIESGAFINSSLIILLLSGNSLASLNAEMFNGLSYLQQFSLKNNKIAGFSSNTFYQMPSLVVLDLSNNQLVVLQPASFLAQLNMFLLDLSANKLIAVPYNAFNQRIVTVLLQENPLVCTERVHILQNGVGVFVPDSADVICGGSPRLPQSTPNDAPAFVQASTVSSVGNRLQIQTTENNFSVNPNVSGVFRPLASGVTNGNPQVTVKPIIQPLTQFPTTINGAPNSVNPVSSGFVPGQQQFEVIHSPTTIPPPRQPVVVPDGPLVQQPGPNLNVQNPNNIQIPAFGKTPFPHFPPKTDDGGFVPPAFQGVNNGGEPFASRRPLPGGNTDFFWTTPAIPEAVTPAQPYTIPFLSQGPIVGPAFAIGPAFSLPPNFEFPGTPMVKPVISDTETLPPSIIVAALPPWTTPKVKQQLDTVKPYPDFPTEIVRYIDSGDRATLSASNRTTTDLLPFQVKTVPPKKSADDFPGPDAAVGGDFNNDPNNPTAKTSATTTIAVCLTVVVVVMVAVFVTLCVVRQKSGNGKKSVSSASRTSAYVAAQAARMNYAAAAAAAASTYGTGAYVREPPPRPPRTGKSAVGKFAGSNNAAQPQNTQTWIYAPSTYASASQYYK